MRGILQNFSYLKCSVSDSSSELNIKFNCYGLSSVFEAILCEFAIFKNTQPRL